MSIQNPFTDNKQNISKFTVPEKSWYHRTPIEESENMLNWFIDRFELVKPDNLIERIPTSELSTLLQRVVSGNEPMIRKKNTDEFLADIDKITSED